MVVDGDFWVVASSDAVDSGAASEDMILGCDLSSFESRRKIPVILFREERKTRGEEKRRVSKDFSFLLLVFGWL